jgi:hypothetical protein
MRNWQMTATLFLHLMPIELAISVAQIGRTFVKRDQAKFLVA